MLRSSIDRWRHKIRKFVVEFFQNVRNRPQSLCQILRMVTVKIVIHSRIWAYILPVCIVALGVMLLISSYCCFFCSKQITSRWYSVLCETPTKIDANSMSHLKNQLCGRPLGKTNYARHPKWYARASIYTQNYARTESLYFTIAN